MSKSLEALDVLFTQLENANKVIIVRECNILYQTIKQDLEYLEQLDKENLDLMSEIQEVHKENLTIKEIKKELERLRKENQELIVNKNVTQAVAFDQKREIAELKDKIAYLQEELEGSQSLYEWSQSKNSILKLENQELKEENQKLKKDYNLLDTTMESDDRIICELLKEKEDLKECYNNLLNELEQMKMEQINKVDNLSVEESMKFIFNKGWNDAIDTISVKISLKLLSKILDKCEVNE